MSCRRFSLAVRNQENNAADEAARLRWELLEMGCTCTTLTRRSLSISLSRCPIPCAGGRWGSKPCNCLPVGKEALMKKIYYRYIYTQFRITHVHAPPLKNRKWLRSSFPSLHLHLHHAMVSARQRFLKRHFFVHLSHSIASHAMSGKRGNGKGVPECRPMDSSAKSERGWEETTAQE